VECSGSGHLVSPLLAASLVEAVASLRRVARLSSAAGRLVEARLLAAYRR
jgi:hypothetical protein